MRETSIQQCTCTQPDSIQRLISLTQSDKNWRWPATQLQTCVFRLIEIMSNSTHRWISLIEIRTFKILVKSYISFHSFSATFNLRLNGWICQPTSGTHEINNECMWRSIIMSFMHAPLPEGCGTVSQRHVFPSLEKSATNIAVVKLQAFLADILNIGRTSLRSRTACSHWCAMMC